MRRDVVLAEGRRAEVGAAPDGRGEKGKLEARMAGDAGIQSRGVRVQRQGPIVRRQIPAHRRMEVSNRQKSRVLPRQVHRSQEDGRRD